MTTESEIKLKQVYSNLKNFFILDVDLFVSNMKIDTTKKTNIYLINTEIQKLILSLAKLKKYIGIIYITKNLSKKLHDTLYEKFKDKPEINKFVLIDNGYIPKHQDLYEYFDEVIFFERFRKNKIIECKGFEKTSNNALASLLMDEVPESK